MAPGAALPLNHHSRVLFPFIFVFCSTLSELRKCNQRFQCPLVSFLGLGKKSSAAPQLAKAVSPKCPCILRICMVNHPMVVPVTHPLPLQMFIIITRSPFRRVRHHLLMHLISIASAGSFRPDCLSLHSIQDPSYRTSRCMRRRMVDDLQILWPNVSRLTSEG